MPDLQTEALVFIEGREVARHLLRSEQHVLGSSFECNIRIDAVGVCDRHAALTVGTDGSLLLEDLGSSSGTYLDGRHVETSSPVAPHQVISLGAAQLVVLQHHDEPPDGKTEISDGDTQPTGPTSPRRYDLGTQIARGGMGAILSAWQPSLRREVAVKMMLCEPRDEDRRRFIEEAQITGRLEHPNIVPVHELNFDERSQPYYSMKLVKGTTLKSVIDLLIQGAPGADVKYPFAALLTIFQKVCDGVAFAHAKGVIHRDLKPANIMIGDYGEVLVMDWGLAKTLSPKNGDRPPDSASANGDRADESEHLATRDGALMGTPRYMSPEQARGEVSALDARSDIFSLGAILYELVTLSPPFRGRSTREILENITSGQFDLPNARLKSEGAIVPVHLPGRSVPDSLEAVILQALATDRADRYQHVEEFQTDLAAYQGGFATRAENAGPWKQFKLLLSRHQLVSATIAASLLLLIGVSTAFTRRLIQERNRAENGEQTAQKETANALAASRQFHRQLQEASRVDEATAEEHFNRNEWSDAFLYLARALRSDPENTSAALRLYQAAAFAVPAQAGLPRRVLGAGDGAFTGDFSPDGSRIVTANNDGTARLWDAATGEPLGHTMRQVGRLWSAKFSPDGKRVVTAGLEKAAHLWDAATGDALGDPLRHDDQVNVANFSPDGRFVVTASSDRTARLWDATTGAPLGIPMRHTNFILDAGFSPDSTRVVTASVDQTARVWDARTGLPLTAPVRHDSRVVSASFSPDGTRVITGTQSNGVRVWNAANGDWIGEPIQSGGPIREAWFSPDGTRILTASFDGTARLWDASTGAAIGQPMRHAATVWSARFSADGLRIVTAGYDQIVRFWDGRTAGPIGQPLHHEGWLSGALFSPDGTQVLTLTEDRPARLWTPPTGQALGEPLHSDGVTLTCASFSPDGTRIVTDGGSEAIQVWNASTGAAIVKSAQHQRGSRSVVFSPDGTRILAAGQDGIARLWDATTGQLLSPEFRTTGQIVGAEFSPDGRRIVTAAADAQVWDVATGARVGDAMHHESGVSSASFSPDGTRVVTASLDKTARVWDAGTGHPLGQPVRPGEWVMRAHFDATSTRIVTASYNKIARVWDAATSQPLGEPMNHSWAVPDASFSPDGRFVLTASYDSSARLWDAATGRSLGRPLLDRNSLSNASFSPDGKRVVTCGDDVRIWEVGILDQTLTPVPDWLPDWAESIGGMRFDAHSGPRAVEAPEQIRRLYAAREGADPWSRLARWVVTPSAQRTIDPASMHSARAIAERERASGTPRSLESALTYDCTLPLVRLLLAASEQDPQRAAFLRDYDLEHLLESAEDWARAVVALKKQGDIERAKRALDKLTAIAPDTARHVRKDTGL